MSSNKKIRSWCILKRLNYIYLRVISCFRLPEYWKHFFHIAQKYQKNKIYDKLYHQSKLAYLMHGMNFDLNHIFLFFFLWWLYIVPMLTHTFLTFFLFFSWFLNFTASKALSSCNIHNYLIILFHLFLKNSDLREN